MTRKYGDERTSLTLAEKAEKAYAESDPIRIYEHEDDNGIKTYSMEGIIEAYNLTTDEVNEYLEDLYDECFADNDQ